MVGGQRALRKKRESEMGFQEWLVGNGKRVAAVVVGCAVLGGCAGSGGRETGMKPDMAVGVTKAGIYFGTVRLKDGSEARFAVYVPWALPAGPVSPAAVFLNGSGECGTDGTKQLAVGMLPAMLQDAEGWPLIGIFPQKPTRESKWEDHTELVIACAEAAIENFCVDPDRVALTGLSQGGHGVWMIGAARPDLWSCLAPICGPMEAGATADVPKGTPVWAFHGTADDVVPVDMTERAVAEVKAQRGIVGAENFGRPATAGVWMTLYDGVNHNSWDKAYRDEGLGMWMAAQRRGVPRGMAPERKMN